MEPLPPIISAEEESEILARHDFTDTAEKFGRDVALDMFNRRVSRWANSFTDYRLRRAAYVIGSAMDGETHEFSISKEGLRSRYARVFHEEIPASTFNRHILELVKAGVVVRTHRKQGEDTRYPGAQAPNHYLVHFSKVLRHGKVVPHDMTVPLPEKVETRVSNSSEHRDECRVELRDESQVECQVESQVERHTLITTSSSTSSPTSSPTARAREGRYWVESQGRDYWHVDDPKIAEEQEWLAKYATPVVLDQEELSQLARLERKSRASAKEFMRVKRVRTERVHG